MKNEEQFFKFMPKQATYNYLKNRHKEGNRIVVSRYGDGEYNIITGRKKKAAKQIVSKELGNLLIHSVKTKGQLVCLPAKIKINSENLYYTKGIKFSDFLSRYFIQNTNHSLYGQGRWRMIDILRYNSEFITNFFLEKTLIVTGHKEDTENAFKKNSQVEVYETPLANAAAEYEIIRKEITLNCGRFKNIIFACGPLSKILIADLINRCNSHLIDLGSVVGILVNPFSSGVPAVKKWSGFGKNGNKEVVERCSVDFFKTLRRKMENDIC